ncbi:SDR family NAD(P)-dependent oxidoreductase [Flammeovirga sp. SubArs3]|uniref:SDR family NAD(P)-dependent oxidoreductase n=1 Tax=Flammeovirga sp. SubArs3 TaxID=2995316 RepID=UPI00248A9CD3|nr:SDR family NAD(P)-dependent oxidoreductase [Flammeovirga sp. SubArs3]
MKYFNNKNVFITGGTSGIGLEMGKQLSKFGAHVVLFGRKGLEEAKETITLQSDTNKVHAIYTETTDLNTVVSAFAEGNNLLGGVDIVIHSAGIGRCVPFNDFAKDDFEELINVNVFGTRNVAEAAFPLLKASQGQLMLIASLAGIVTNYGYSAYSSSKFATIGFAGVLRSEWKPMGVQVSVACPPEIDTPLVEAERLESPKVAKVLKQFAGNLPLEVACKKMLRRLANKNYMIIPGWKAKFVAINQGLFPSLNNRITDFIIRMFLKKEL